MAKENWSCAVPSLESVLTKTIVSPSPSTLSFLACRSQSDVSAFLGTTRTSLVFHLYAATRPAYASFHIAKKGGGSRHIEIPPEPVKSWQRILHAVLSEMYVPKKSTHGFVSNRSIRTNADMHINRRNLLCIDLENFFPSIHFGRVCGVFSKPPFSFPKEVAATLAQLCTYAGRLPQGAPTSPVLSNLVCRKLDTLLFRFCRRHGCRFTRYADDIAISTNRAVFPRALVSKASAEGSNTQIELGRELHDIIRDQDFRVNSSKTRIRSPRQRQEVTGLTVNVKRNVRRTYLRRVRAVLKDIEVNGYVSAEARFNLLDSGRKHRLGSSPKLRDHVYGCLEFIRSIRGTDDAVFVKYAIKAKRLGCRSCPVPLLGSPARDSEFYRHAIWIVLGMNARGTEVSQGTAFCLQGTGFLTAAHVFQNLIEPVTTWKLIRAIEPFDEYHIRGYSQNSPIDLALLDVDAKPHAMFVRSDERPAPGDQHRLLGFQNWKTIADKPMDAPAVVVQVTKYFASDFLMFDHPIVEGNSGGPVLSQHGKVVGVIATSAKNSVVPNGAISIEHTANLAGVASTPLP